MRGWRLSAGLAGLALVVPLWAAPLGAAEARLISIATGAKSGVYYYAGGTICGRSGIRQAYL